MPSVAKIIQGVTYWPVYFILRFFLHYEVRGQEHLDGLSHGAIIFASNHASYLDGPISGASMPRRRGQWYPKDFFPLRFLVLDRFFRWRYLAAALYVWMNGSIQVTRNGGNLHGSLSETLTALRRGEKIWIYPEGRLTRDGTLQPGKRGVAYLHRETGAPIVPVGITGNFKALSWGTLVRKHKVIVQMGPPISSLDNPGSSTLEVGTGKVMKAIEGLLIRQ